MLIFWGLYHLKKKRDSGSVVVWKFDFVTDFELILLKVSARNKSYASFISA